MPHGNAQGAGLCVLFYKTCMPPLTSTHNIPLTGLSAATAPIRAHQPARDHTRRDRARVSHGRRGRRAAHPRTRLRAAATVPTGTATWHHPHGAQRTRTDGHTQTYIARVPMRPRARATRSPRHAARSAAAGRPTAPPPHILIDLPEAGRSGGATPDAKMRSTAADRGSAAVERRGWERARNERVRACGMRSASAAYHFRDLETEKSHSAAPLSCR